MHMEHPFDNVMAVAKNRKNPEFWIYCDTDYLNHFLETEQLIEKSVEKDIFWFLYQGARIGIRPLRDVRGHHLIIVKKEDLQVEKLVTKKLKVPLDLALHTYCYYCEECMS